VSAARNTERVIKNLRKERVEEWQRIADLYVSMLYEKQQLKRVSMFIEAEFSFFLERNIIAMCTVLGIWSFFFQSDIRRPVTIPCATNGHSWQPSLSILLQVYCRYFIFFNL
jgi:hypothetical protein